MSVLPRRKSTESYDALLLDGIIQCPAFHYLVGQGNLLDLSQAFDEHTKKPSLVAKLNRWKSDKNWVNWASPDDLKLLPDGEKARLELLVFSRRDGSLDEIKRAFRDACGLDVDPSD